MTEYNFLTMEKREFDLLLQTTYPNLYQDMYGDPLQTCLSFGCEIPPAWREIVFNGSAKLEKIISSLSENERKQVKATQVKSKFGTLRFYISIYPTSEEKSKAINTAIDDMEKAVSKIVKSNAS